MKRVENLPNEIAGRQIFVIVFWMVNIFACKLICWSKRLWVLHLVELSVWLLWILVVFFEE